MGMEQPNDTDPTSTAPPKTPKKHRQIKKKGKIGNDKFVAYTAAHGYHVSRGRKIMPDGRTRHEKFYLGQDYTDALRRKQIIIAEFAKLEALGTTTWTPEAYDHLRTQGALSAQKTERVTLRQSEAIQLYQEPLTDTELSQFCDPNTGMMKPEHAIQAADLDARKVFSLPEVRGRFHEQVLNQAKSDPLNTLERMSKLFGWTGKETSQFVLNLNTNGSPIAYDASEATYGIDISDQEPQLFIENPISATPDSDN